MLFFRVWILGASANGWGAFSNELLELSSCERTDKNSSRRWEEPRPVPFQKCLCYWQLCAREVGARTEEIPIPSRLPSRVLRGARGAGEAAWPALPGSILGKLKGAHGLCRKLPNLSPLLQGTLIKGFPSEKSRFFPQLGG